MKMDFHAYVFRFKRMGILEKINNKHAQPRIKKTFDNVGSLIEEI